MERVAMRHARNIMSAIVTRAGKGPATHRTAQHDDAPHGYA